MAASGQKPERLPELAIAVQIDTTLHRSEIRVSQGLQRSAHSFNRTAMGQGFEFLGYRFEAGRRWVRKKSLMSLRDKIRAKTKRNEGNSIEYVIASLNPTLRGWYGYFQHAHRFTFTSIDGFIRRRLRAMLRRQKHRPGQGRCLRDHQQWPNAFFADLGLFTMHEAH
jgi:RNA-directed DNA polymerase